MRRCLPGNVVKGNALQPLCQQRLGIGNELAHYRIDRADDPALHIAWIAFGTDQEALAHRGIYGVKADLFRWTQQAPATVMPLGRSHNSGFPQLPQHSTYHDRVGHQALRQGRRRHRGIGLLMQMHKGMEGKGKPT